ncbi:MAG: hypothetical protein GX647_05460 [Clostridiales bacterium]|jgi:hypothetical protein|nr:hypothetical protein [Clostridiales bacterium]OPZ66971.1 MAG: hypothetical protein BWY81_01559 [Firmicutes bacterium ADurb.Bin467]
MQTQKRVKIRLNARTVLPMSAAAIALVLIILVCIFAVSTSNIRNEYAQARTAVGEELYEKLNMFIRSYQGISLAGADVEGTILPTMHDYFVAATALDEAIAVAYGDRYAVLRGGIDTAITAAFEAFDEAFRQGQSPAAAISSMSSCVQALEETLLKRFDSDLRLLPAG